MKAYFALVLAILFVFICFPLSSDTYYLREHCVAPPDKPEQVFLHPVNTEVAQALKDSRIFRDIPAIIPAAAIRKIVPPESPIIGGAVKYIPLGTVPADKVEKVFGLMDDLSKSGNGRNVVIEIPNWREMIKDEPVIQPISTRSAERLVRGGDYVKVIMKKGNILIQLQGRAQRSGAEGDIIPVMATATRKQLQCTILDRREVSLIE